MSAAGRRLRPAIFLDRDGTLIEDRGNLSHPNQVVFLPGAIQALQVLRDDFAFFVVTNQSGVAKGHLTLEQVAAVNAYVVSELAKAGVPIERVFVCPHARTDGCDCIKPKPHFLRVAEREHHIDLRRSFTVGDHPHDVEFASSVGATGIYVLTGHGVKHRGELDPAHCVVESLAHVLPLLSNLRCPNDKLQPQA